jgi:hypothetical protein
LSEIFRARVKFDDGTSRDRAPTAAAEWKKAQRKLPNAH